MNVAELVVIVPLGPESITVSGAVVSIATVKVRVAGVGSVLPFASVACTWKVWEPLVIPVSARGELHDWNVPPSNLHSNVEPDSFAEKPNEVDAVVTVEPSAGPELIVVSGGVWSVVSTVKVRVAGVASVLPASSVDRTWKVCGPLERLVRVRGEEHDANSAPSSLHRRSRRSAQWT